MDSRKPYRGRAVQSETTDSKVRAADSCRGVVLVIAVGCFVTIAGCHTTGPSGMVGGGDASTDGGISLRKDIMPLFELNGCATCHNDVTDQRTHRTDFRTADSVYVSLINKQSFDHCVDGGSDEVGIDTPLLGEYRVAPGDPAGSFLLQKLREPHEMCGTFYGRMPPPPRARMAASDIDVVEEWIAQGALNN